MAADQGLKSGDAGKKQAETLQKQNPGLLKMQRMVGNDFIKQKVEDAQTKEAENPGAKPLDKQMVDVFLRLGLDIKVCEGLAQGIAALSATGWDPTITLGMGPNGIAPLAGPGGSDTPYTCPQLATALADPYANEYLEHTLAILTGESVIGAHIEEIIEWWKVLGIRPAVADELGSVLATLAFEERKHDEKKKVDPKARETAMSVVGKIPFSRYL